MRQCALHAMLGALCLGVLQALVRERVREALRNSADVHWVLAKALEGAIKQEVWTRLDFPHRSYHVTLLASLRYSKWKAAQVQAFQALYLAHPSTFPTGQCSCTTTTFTAHRGSTATP
uniref:Secreted protein n=1 Tax=Chromera velia CCMP2878 TaxID=1169474 RepID=A0A0G4I134_9ALVE|eukprot:Cvel_1645.t1-p1 / transcript=Cvel_1645.t1 / gene=Cvel_1645 / organism=Chromera_velia_CCMP2878 / gene_product=hypothetical protein / transcript_product=hypothetical protein / location=Cvel_scaffold59:73170-83723(+) / protein_length=117 / sequence_SO=supercontig / SO=protein_coding / is_pseudo=false